MKDKPSMITIGSESVPIDEYLKVKETICIVRETRVEITKHSLYHKPTSMVTKTKVKNSKVKTVVKDELFVELMESYHLFGLFANAPYFKQVQIWNKWLKGDHLHMDKLMFHISDILYPKEDI